jgi:hypothetical protein
VRQGGKLTFAEVAPPLSIFYPPSSHRSFTKLISTALPAKSLPVSARTARYIYIGRVAALLLLSCNSPWSELTPGYGSLDCSRLDPAVFNCTYICICFLLAMPQSGEKLTRTGDRAAALVIMGRRMGCIIRRKGSSRRDAGQA